MSRKGNCYDNAPMESFRGVLKNEQIHHCGRSPRPAPPHVPPTLVRITGNPSVSIASATRFCTSRSGVRAII